MRLPSSATRLRTWAVMAMGLVLTTTAMVWAGSAQTSYVGAASIIFVRSSERDMPNPLSTGIGSLIDVAAVVDRVINGAPHDQGVLAADLTLADQGISRATEVRLVNNGSQWADDFNRPVLEVNVVAPTHPEAQRMLTRAVDRVAETLNTLQRQAHAARDSWVFMRLAPATLRISPASGHPLRALLATLVLGAGLTVSLGRWVGRSRT